MQAPLGARIATTAARFAAIYTGAVADVLDRRGLLDQTLPPDLVPLSPEMRLASPAYPVEGRPHSGHDYDASIRRFLAMLGTVPPGTSSSTRRTIGRRRSWASCRSRRCGHAAARGRSSTAVA